MNIKEKRTEVLIKSELAEVLSKMGNDDLRKVQKYVSNLKQPSPSHSVLNGELESVTVKTTSGLNDCQIELVQAMEKDIDKAMLKNGFARTTTSKAGDKLLFIYRQFGKAL